MRVLLVLWRWGETMLKVVQEGHHLARVRQTPWAMSLHLDTSLLVQL